jgi:hypothetical protein
VLRPTVEAMAIGRALVDVVAFAREMMRRELLVAS